MLSAGIITFFIKSAIYGLRISCNCYFVSFFYKKSIMSRETRRYWSISKMRKFVPVYMNTTSCVSS